MIFRERNRQVAATRLVRRVAATRLRGTGVLVCLQTGRRYAAACDGWGRRAYRQVAATRLRGTGVLACLQTGRRYAADGCACVLTDRSPLRGCVGRVGLACYRQVAATRLRGTGAADALQTGRR